MQSAVVEIPIKCCISSQFSTPKELRNHLYDSKMYDGQYLYSFHSQIKTSRGHKMWWFDHIYAILSNNRNITVKNVCTLVITGKMMITISSRFSAGREEKDNHIKEKIICIWLSHRVQDSHNDRLYSLKII